MNKILTFFARVGTKVAIKFHNIVSRKPRALRVRVVRTLRKYGKNTIGYWSGWTNTVYIDEQWFNRDVNEGLHDTKSVLDKLTYMQRLLVLHEAYHHAIKNGYGHDDTGIGATPIDKALDTTTVEEYASACNELYTQYPYMSLRYKYD